MTTTVQLQMDGGQYTALGNYAAEKQTTIQKLLMNYINSLLLVEAQEKSVPPVVARLRGCAANTEDSGDINARQGYYEHLQEKHQ